MTRKNRTFLTLAVVAIACFALTTTAQAVTIASQTFESINMNFGSGPSAPFVVGYLGGTAPDLGLEGAGKRYSTAALAADEDFVLGDDEWDLEVGGSHAGAVSITSNTLSYNAVTSASHLFTFTEDAKYTPPPTLFAGPDNDNWEVMAKFDEVDVSGYKDKTLSFDLALNGGSDPYQLYFRLFLDGSTGIDIMTVSDDTPTYSLASGVTYADGTVSVNIADSVNSVELFMGGRHDEKLPLVIDNVSIDGTVVPEPSTIALAAFGLLGLIGFGRRRKR